MREFPQDFSVGLGRADIELPIDLPRVHTDQPHGKPARQLDREICFTHRSRSGDAYDPRGRCSASLILHLICAIAPLTAALPSPVEPFINLRQIDLPEGRSTMIALPGAFGLLHLAQQCVHLSDSEMPVLAYGSMARYRRQHTFNVFGYSI